MLSESAACVFLLKCTERFKTFAYFQVHSDSGLEAALHFSCGPYRNTTRAMVAAALHDRAVVRRDVESPHMVANLIYACEMTQHTQSHTVLKKARDIRSMRHSESGVPDAAPHDAQQQTRIARRLGLGKISKYMKEAFDSMISDLEWAFEHGKKFIAKAINKLKKFLQGLGIRTDFIDNFAPPKIGFQIQKSFGWKKEFGQKKYVKGGIGFNMNAMGKAQASIFDFSMTFEVRGEAYLKLAAVNEQFKIDVVKAQAHFRATSQMVFPVPTDMGTVAGMLNAVNQFVTGIINKVLLFLQRFKAKIDVYIQPAKNVVKNIRLALNTVMDVQKTLNSTKQTLDEVTGMVDGGALGDAILTPLFKFLDVALKPLKKDINAYFDKTKPTITKFTGYVNKSINFLEAKVAFPMRKGTVAAQNLMDMYDDAVEKVVGKVEAGIEQVKTLLSTNLLALEDTNRIKKYFQAFKGVTEAVATMTSWTAKARRLQGNANPGSALVKVLKFEQADAYVMQTLTKVKEAIQGGDAYDALAKLNATQLPNALKQITAVTEKLQKPTAAIRKFLKLSGNGTSSVKTLIKKGIVLANASLVKLAAILKDPLAGFLADYTDKQLAKYSVNNSLVVNTKNSLSMENFGNIFLKTMNLNKLKPEKKASITVANIAQDVLKTIKLDQLAAGVLPKLSDFVLPDLQTIGLAGLVDLKRQALKVNDLSVQLLSTWGLNKLVATARAKLTIADFSTEKTSGMHLSDLADTVLPTFTVDQLDATTTKDLNLSIFALGGIKSLHLSEVNETKRPLAKALNESVGTLSNDALRQIKLQDLTANGAATINKLGLDQVLVQARDTVDVSGVVLSTVLGQNLNSLVPVMFDRLRINDLKPLVLDGLTLEALEKDLLGTINLGNLTQNKSDALDISNLKDGTRKNITLDKLKPQVLAKWNLAKLQDKYVKAMTLTSLEKSFLKSLSLKNSLTTTLDLNKIKLTQLSVGFRMKLKPKDVSTKLLEELDVMGKKTNKFANLVAKAKDFKGKLDYGIGKVNEFCKTHKEEGWIGVAKKGVAGVAKSGAMAQAIGKFKSVLTTVDWLKRGNETLCVALDTSKKVLDKIAPPLIRMCKNVDAVKAAGLEQTVNVHLTKLEVSLREALVRAKQLSIDYVREKSEQKQSGKILPAVAGKVADKVAVPIARRAAVFTKQYISPLMSALKKLPVANMVNVVKKVKYFLEQMGSLSDNIKSYGEPGGTDFDTFQQKFPRMISELDRLIQKSGIEKYAAKFKSGINKFANQVQSKINTYNNSMTKYTDKIKDVLSNFDVMGVNAKSWLSQMKVIIGNSTEVCALTRACLEIIFQ